MSLVPVKVGKEPRGGRPQNRKRLISANEQITQAVNLMVPRPERLEEFERAVRRALNEIRKAEISRRLHRPPDKQEKRAARDLKRDLERVQRTAAKLELTPDRSPFADEEWKAFLSMIATYIGKCGIVTSTPFGKKPRPDAWRKYWAAQEAVEIFRNFGPAHDTRIPRLPRLAAILFGDPELDLTRHCAKVQKPRTVEARSVKKAGSK